MGGHVKGNVVGTVNQNIGQELEKVAELIKMMRADWDKMDLNERQKDILGSHVSQVEKELNVTEPSKKIISSLLESIKSIMEDVTGNLIAPGIVSMISKIKIW